MADWCKLPTDILGEIALRIDMVKDFIHFSAVCHSWNFVYSMVKLQWIASKPSPWLLLGEPSPSKKELQYERKIFSVVENKCFKYELPETFKARCWGTSFGWIVLVGLDQKIQLFNPITKAKLSLPPLQTVPGYPEDEDEERWFQKVFVQRVLVLKIPRSDSVGEFELVVMMIHWHLDHLAFARPKDRVWTPILTTCTRPCQVSDVLQRDKLILILYQDGALAYCDTSDLDLAPEPVKAKIYVPAPAPVNFFSMAIDNVGELYLAELRADLIVISRSRYDYLGHNEKYCYYTSGFKVHKLNYKTKLWEQVEDLGEFSLFVGHNTALSFQAALWKQNAIYFTDDEREFLMDDIFRGEDMGAYDMASQKIERFYEGDDALCKYSPPTWFMPQH